MEENKNQPSDQDSNSSNTQKPKKLFECLKKGNDDDYCKSWYLKK